MSVKGGWGDCIVRIVAVVVILSMMGAVLASLLGPEVFAPLGALVSAVFRPVAVLAIELFNRPSVIYALSGLLILLAAAFCAAYWLDVASDERGKLARLRRAVVGLTPMDGPAAPTLPQSLEDLGGVLRGHGLFLMAYDDLMNARNAHGRLPEAPFQAMVNARDWRSHGAQRDFYSALPGYFTSVGLLLTFIGLVAALHFAARGFESGSAEQAKTAILQLLSASSFKFLTSIAALAGAIMISVSVRLLDAYVRREAAHTAEAIEAHLESCRALERVSSLAAPLARRSG